MSQICNELLPWVWAYREQLYLLDRHDATWIEAAKNGWCDKQLYEMLKTYRLIRGRAARLFGEKNKESRLDFLRICEFIFKNPLYENDRILAMQNLWDKSFRESGELGHALDGKNITLRSATSKLFWFYQPQNMVMFDQYNRRGLAQWAKRNNKIHRMSDISAENFLCRFEEYFTEHAILSIENVETLFGRKYPYARRVAEKRLWLSGSGKEREILCSLQHGLTAAPRVTGL